MTNFAAHKSRPRLDCHLKYTAPYQGVETHCMVFHQQGRSHRSGWSGSTWPLSGALSHVFVVNQRLMTARTSFKASLPSLPDVPHHLKDVAFPKQTFRKSKPVHAVLCVESVVQFLAIPALWRSRGNPNYVTAHSMCQRYAYAFTILDSCNRIMVPRLTILQVCKSWARGKHAVALPLLPQKLHQKQSQKAWKFQKILGGHAPRPP